MSVKTLSFLWTSSKDSIFSNTEHSDGIKIRCQLRDSCLNHVDDVKTLNKVVSSKKMCPSCYTFWSEGKYSLSLDSRKKHSRNFKRLISKDADSCNRFQRKLVSYFSKTKDITMVLNCKVCFTKTKLYFTKPTNSKEQLECPEDSNHFEDSLAVKKKKKKKDGFAGLNKDAILNYRMSASFNSTETTPLSNKKKNKHKKNVSLNLKYNGGASETVDAVVDSPLNHFALENKIIKADLRLIDETLCKTDVLDIDSSLNNDCNNSMSNSVCENTQKSANSSVNESSFIESSVEDLTSFQSVPDFTNESVSFPSTPLSNSMVGFPKTFNIGSSKMESPLFKSTPILEGKKTLTQPSFVPLKVNKNKKNSPVTKNKDSSCLKKKSPITATQSPVHQTVNLSSLLLSNKSGKKKRKSKEAKRRSEGPVAKKPSLVSSFLESL